MAFILSDADIGRAAALLTERRGLLAEYAARSRIQALSEIEPVAAGHWERVLSALLALAAA